ncbi:MAG: nitrite reductase (NADH) small subunit [Limisphaerales bacterium]|jgi:nitrite reductase (NADH) small subunit
MTISQQVRHEACAISDLAPNAGVAVRISNRQIALFYLPDETPCVYAIDNYDPISEVNVLSRGIVGDKQGELVVASPIYKQHFSLVSGQCLEEEGAGVKSYPVALEGDAVFLWL